ncbi:MAG: segregation/condensation protein A, partial [Paenibacillus macerans]|nr:segregation/condensation protein A [Paenibacillus macerans]
MVTGGGCSLTTVLYKLETFEGPLDLLLHLI